MSKQLTESEIVDILETLEAFADSVPCWKGKDCFLPFTHGTIQNPPALAWMSNHSAPINLNINSTQTNNQNKGE